MVEDEAERLKLTQIIIISAERHIEAITRIKLALMSLEKWKNVESCHHKICMYIAPQIGVEFLREILYRFMFPLFSRHFSLCPKLSVWYPLCYSDRVGSSLMFRSTHLFDINVCRFVVLLIWLTNCQHQITVHHFHVPVDRLQSWWLKVSEFEYPPLYLQWVHFTIVDDK
jgi:hypothetical protein